MGRKVKPNEYVGVSMPYAGIVFYERAYIFLHTAY